MARALMLATALVLGWLAFGCGDLSVKGSGSKPVSQTATGAPVASPSPDVEITSPARGSFLLPGAIAVEGYARPAPRTGSPLREVKVQGQPVTLDENGRFQTIVNASRGLLIIEATARDAAGVSGSCSVGALVGTFKSMNQPIPDALHLRLNDSSLTAASKIIESVIWALDITGILQGANPIYGTNLLWVRAWVDILQVRFRDVQVSIDCKADGLHVEARLFDAIIDGSAQADLGLGTITSPTTLSLFADEVTARARLTLRTAADGKFRVGIEGTSFVFHNFRANVSSALIQTIEPFIRGLVQDAIVDAVKDAIRDDAVPVMNTALDDYLTASAIKPLKLLDREFRIDVRGGLVAFDADGLSVRTKFDVPAHTLTPRGLAAPGSYSTPGTAPNVHTNSRGVLLTLDDDTLNRALHGFWANGLLDWQLDQAFFDQQGVTMPILLQAGSLRQFIPEIGSAVSDAAPVALRLTGHLPPIVEYTGQPDLLTAHAGEIGFEVLVDRGNGFEVLISAAVFARVGLHADFTQAGLTLSMNTNPELRFDILAEPLVELDDRRIEVMLSLVLTPLIPQLLNGLAVIPVPHLNQLTVFNTQVVVDGNDREHLSVTADMTR